MSGGPWGRRLTPGQWLFKAPRRTALVVGREVAISLATLAALVAALAVTFFIGVAIP